MSNLEYIRAIVDYNHALFDRVWDSVMELTDEQFTQDVDYSHGSVRDQMIHVAETQGGWLRGLKGDPNARQFHLDPSESSTRESLREAWNSFAKDFEGYVETLDELGLQHTPQGFLGPAWGVIAHLVNHGTDHRAQILRILHDFGAPTFDQDMIFRLWNM